MRDHLRTNLIFLMVSLAVFTLMPAIVQAQVKEYSPINFTQALKLDRGSLTPLSQDAVFLDHDGTCDLVVQEFGWERQDCPYIENIVFSPLPSLDNMVINKPNDEGYVKLDDWDQADRDEEIEVIWDSMQEGLKAQGKKLGITVTPLRWYVYPTLNREKNYMYYAILTRWGEDLTLNVKATLFDRDGYVVFQMVPLDSSIASGDLAQVVEETLSAYRPKTKKAYFDFRDGDKVAAVGAIGVLATLVGVKYGKTAAGGFLALLLVFAKKAWFLLLLPLVFLKNLIFGKKNE